MSHVLECDPVLVMLSHPRELSNEVESLSSLMYHSFSRKHYLHLRSFGLPIKHFDSKGYTKQQIHDQGRDVESANPPLVSAPPFS